MTKVSPGTSKVSPGMSGVSPGVSARCATAIFSCQSAFRPSSAQ